MRMCQDHWDRLRALIDERDLGHLVAKDGEMAAQQVAAELDAGEQTPTNYDPLMAAHWSIMSNALDTLRRSGASRSAVYLMQGPDAPEDLIDHEVRAQARRHGVELPKDATWPRCPLCYLNLAHKVSCSGCSLPTEGGYDWMLARAADDQVQRSREVLGGGGGEG